MNKTNNNQPQQYKPQTWMQEKLLTEEGYMPYCGNPRCREMPMTQFNGEQFYCRCCRWESSYPKEYLAKRNNFNEFTIVKFKTRVREDSSIALMQFVRQKGGNEYGK